MIPLASPSRSRNSIARCSVVCRFQLEAQKSIRANPLLFMANNGTCADDGSVAINSLFYCPRFSTSSSLPLCFNLFNIRRKCFTPKFRQFTWSWQRRVEEQENPFQNPTFLTWNYFYVKPSWSYFTCLHVPPLDVVAYILLPSPPRRNPVQCSGTWDVSYNTTDRMVVLFQPITSVHWREGFPEAAAQWFFYGPSSSSNFLFRGIYFPFSEWKTWRKWVIKLGKYNRKPCDISFIPLSWDFLLFDLKIEWSNNQFFSHLLLIILFHGAGGVATWVTSPPPPPLCCNRVLSRGVQRLLAVL